MSINYSIAMLGNPIDEDAPKGLCQVTVHQHPDTGQVCRAHRQPRIQVQPRRHLCRADANRGLHA